MGGAGGGFGRLTHLLDDLLEDVDGQVQQPQRASGPVLALVLGCGGSGWVAVVAAVAVAAVVAVGVPRVLPGQGRAMFVVGRVVVGQRGRGCAGGHGIRVHGGLRNMCAAMWWCVSGGVPSAEVARHSSRAATNPHGDESEAGRGTAQRCSLPCFVERRERLHATNHTAGRALLPWGARDPPPPPGTGSTKQFAQLHRRG